MKNIYWLILLAAMVFASCSKYDDGDLRNEMQQLGNRVTALEKWQNEANSNLASLQSIANTLNGRDYITSITDLKDNTGNVIGCTIHFAKGEAKNIYYGKNGTDGKDGADGKDGVDGKDGSTPAIGVKIDSDGIYYWTLNGNWLLDANGKKIQASGNNGTDGNDGVNGKDGITPKLKIESDYWYVSYDNGSTWQQLGKATTSGTTSSTACIFKSVTVSESYITFVLTDGSSFAVPYGDELSISFTGTESAILPLNTTTEIGYEIKSSTKSVDIEVIGSADILAEIVPENDSKLKGKIKITTGDKLNSQSKVVILVTNGSKVIMRSISFEKETLEITDNANRILSMNEEEFTLEFLTNIDYDVIISDDAKSWITSIGNRAITKQTLTFKASENTGNQRSGTITIQGRNSNQKLVYTITQNGANTITLPADNGIMPGAGTLTAEFVSGDPNTALEKMVDNNTATCYEISGKSQFSFTWKGEEKTYVEKIYLHFGDDPNKQPQGAVLYASNDGISWQYIIGIGSSYLTIVDYTFESKLYYQYFKLDITTDNGAETISLAEFHLIPGEEVIFNTFENVVANASSFTASNATPMGNHYENKHVTTDADKVWLSTASNEPALLESASGYTYRSYTVDLYPFGEPVPADVNQHGIGDCSALAVFAEMAYLFPDFIKSIIKDNGNGTYTVNMFDPQGEPVQVTVQSTFLGDDNGIGAVSGKKGEATWASILEKAIMKWNYIYQVNPDISGIGSEHVAPLFTGEGNSFAFYPSSLSISNLKKAVDLSLEENMIVIGGFTTGGLYVGTYQTVTAHAYSFFLSNNSSSLFAMRNPWGWSPGSNGKEDGILDIIDDDIVPPTIDLRIIYPGIAADYAKETLSPYIPPQW